MAKVTEKHLFFWLKEECQKKDVGGTWKENEWEK